MEFIGLNQAGVICILAIALVIMGMLYLQQRQLFNALADYVKGMDDAKQALLESPHPWQSRYDLFLEHRDCDCAHSGGIMDGIELFDRGRASALGEVVLPHKHAS